jgi:hypothetical protein
VQTNRRFRQLGETQDITDQVFGEDGAASTELCNFGHQLSPEDQVGHK